MYKLVALSILIIGECNVILIQYNSLETYIQNV